jgi:hypothetical protein
MHKSLKALPCNTTELILWCHIHIFL